MKNINNVIHLVSKTLTLSLAVLSAILMMAECISIYEGGEYTRALVAESFGRIAIPCYAFIVSALVGFIIDEAVPADIKKEKSKRSNAVLLRNLVKKIDADTLTVNDAETVKKEQAKRRFHTSLSVALLVLGSLCFVLYLVFGNAFPKESINGEVIRAVIVASLTLLPSLVYTFVLYYVCEKSCGIELAVYKNALASGSCSRKTEEKTQEKKCKCKQYRATLIVAVVSVILIVAGLTYGGTSDVITKAVNICTECIGLG